MPDPSPHSVLDDLTQLREGIKERVPSGWTPHYLAMVDRIEEQLEAAQKEIERLREYEVRWNDLVQRVTPYLAKSRDLLQGVSSPASEPEPS